MIKYLRQIASSIHWGFFFGRSKYYDVIIIQNSIKLHRLIDRRDLGIHRAERRAQFTLLAIELAVTGGRQRMH